MPDEQVDKVVDEYLSEAFGLEGRQAKAEMPRWGVPVLAHGCVLGIRGQAL